MLKYKFGRKKNDLGETLWFVRVSKTENYSIEIGGGSLLGVLSMVPLVRRRMIQGWQSIDLDALGEQ